MRDTIKFMPAPSTKDKPSREANRLLKVEKRQRKSIQKQYGDGFEYFETPRDAPTSMTAPQSDDGLDSLFESRD
jgi:hypothetical protein